MVGDAIRPGVPAAINTVISILNIHVNYDQSRDDTSKPGLAMLLKILLQYTIAALQILIRNVMYPLQGTCKEATYFGARRFLCQAALL